MPRRARQSSGFERTPSQRNTPTHTISVLRRPTQVRRLSWRRKAYPQRPRRRPHRCDAILGVAKRTVGVPADETRLDKNVQATRCRCDAFLGVVKRRVSVLLRQRDADATPHTPTVPSASPPTNPKLVASASSPTDLRLDKNVQATRCRCDAILGVANRTVGVPPTNRAWTRMSKPHRERCLDKNVQATLWLRNAKNGVVPERANAIRENNQ